MNIPAKKLSNITYLHIQMMKKEKLKNSFKIKLNSQNFMLKEEKNKESIENDSLNTNRKLL